MATIDNQRMTSNNDDDDNDALGGRPYVVSVHTRMHSSRIGKNTNTVYPIVCLYWKFCKHFALIHAIFPHSNLPMCVSCCFVFRPAECHGVFMLRSTNTLHPTAVLMLLWCASTLHSGLHTAPSVPVRCTHIRRRRWCALHKKIIATVWVRLE